MVALWAEVGTDVQLSQVVESVCFDACRFVRVLTFAKTLALGARQVTSELLTQAVWSWFACVRHAPMCLHRVCQWLIARDCIDVSPIDDSDRGHFRDVGGL